MEERSGWQPRTGESSAARRRLGTVSSDVRMADRPVPRRRGSPARAFGQRAMSFLDEQRLDPTPENYMLAYSSQSDPRSPLAVAVFNACAGGMRMSQAQADEIIARHLITSADASAPEDEMRATVRLQTLRLADLTADAASATGDLNRDLTMELDALTSGSSGIAARITTMIARSEKAERGLSEAARQVEVLRQELDAARSDANLDALTGLANRRGVERHLAALVEAGRGISVAICDVDHFKAVNDRFGHPVGDRVLKVVAGTLADACAPHLVARWGGEEFLVIMDDVDLTSAAALVDDARSELARRQLRVRSTDEVIGSVTFSAGVASTCHARSDDLISKADDLLYEAKKSGRNRVLPL